MRSASSSLSFDSSSNVCFDFLYERNWKDILFRWSIWNCDPCISDRLFSLLSACSLLTFVIFTVRSPAVTNDLADVELDDETLRQKLIVSYVQHMRQQPVVWFWRSILLPLTIEVLLITYHATPPPLYLHTWLVLFWEKTETNDLEVKCHELSAEFEGQVCFDCLALLAYNQFTNCV